ncbi:hypothetical protein WJX82_008384 [Trebouxia sp. C0006]
MDTSNKIRVVDRDTFQMTRTYSGGVRDPSDPKHYPTLVGTEGTVGAAASKRTLSTPGSFKETLLRTRLRTADRADEPAAASQTIPAHRSVEGDEPVQGGVGGLEVLRLSTPSQQDARMDSQEDGFAPCSPKKVVTQAAQRRRTADEQAREERFHRDLAHPHAFAALVDDGVLFGSQILGRANKCKTSMLSWTRR